MAITLSIDNTFTNGISTLDATTMNANFTDVVTWSKTFATSTGYVFTTPASGDTAVTINGVTSQSVDILDVALTSGGTTAFSINKSGAAVFGNIGGGALTNAAAITGGGSGSLLLNHTTGQTLIFGSGASGGGAPTVSFTTGGAISPTASTVRTVAGSLLGFYVSAGGTLEITMDTSGNMGINGSLSQASSIVGKTNIAASSYDYLPDILSVKPVTYNFEGEPADTPPHLGFISETAPASLVRTDSVEPYGLCVANMIALQRVCEKLKAAAVPGF